MPGQPGYNTRPAPDCHPQRRFDSILDSFPTERSTLAMTVIVKDILLVFLMFASSHAERKVPFNRMSGKRADGIPFYSRNHATETSCAAQCLSLTDCVAFNYNTETQLCDLHNGTRSITDDSIYTYGIMGKQYRISSIGNLCHIKVKSSPLVIF